MISQTCRLLTSIKTGINCLLISGFVSPALALDGFTQADRERSVRVDAVQTAFMQQVDKRFGQTFDMNWPWRPAFWPYFITTSCTSWCRVSSGDRASIFSGDRGGIFPEILICLSVWLAAGRAAQQHIGFRALTWLVHIVLHFIPVSHDYPMSDEDLRSLLIFE